MPQPSHTPELVRELYVGAYRRYTGRLNYGQALMPKWDGGQTQYGARCTPVWPRLAKSFAAMEIDPRVYIPWAFSHSGNIPQPNRLLAETAVKLFRETHTTQALLERADLEFAADLVSFQAALTPALNHMGPAAVRQTLLNEDVCKSTALFRYCFGVLYDLSEVTSRYFGAAQYQYHTNQPSYDAVWDHRLLTGLRMNHG